MANRSKRTAVGAPTLDLFSAVAELTALREQSVVADLAYHGADAPIMPDAAYDAIVRQDEAIVAAFPAAAAMVPARAVGPAPAAGFRAVPHLAPMQGLDNAWTFEDLDAFVNRAIAVLAPHGRTPTFDAEQKIDGLSLSLTYQDGVLHQALTRGDGVEGEDVHANARTIGGIPHQLPAGVPALFEVRGEAYMRRSTFAAANARRVKMGKEPFANLRNAAAGSVRQTDPEETRARNVVFAAYGLGSWSGTPVATENQLLKTLDEMTIATVSIHTQCKTTEELWAAFGKMATTRIDLDHDIDGMVVKVSSLEDRILLGTTGRSPRWAIAVKFPAERGITTLQEIDIQVGRSGTLTPVARFRPVSIGGVMVSNATLHNEDHVASLKLCIGDTIEIERAGDVIPRVLGTVPRTPTSGVPWKMPLTCPSCGAMARRDPGEAAMRCSNALSCSATAIARFSHLTSRDVFDIDGLGDGKLESLLSLGLLKEPADLWQLHNHRQTIRCAHGWATTSTDNMLASIEARREMPLHRFVTSLLIREIGRTASRAIAAKYGTAANVQEILFKAADDNQQALDGLQAIDGIGPIMVYEIVNWAREPRNVEAMIKLMKELTIMDTVVAAPAERSALTDKVMVFTGKLRVGTREDAEHTARLLGARPSGSISAKTDILVVGENGGSKRSKAEGLNKKAASMSPAGHQIRIIDEDEWYRMAAVGNA